MDNSSDDHIETHGAEVSVASDRQRIVSTIYEISKTGKQRFNTQGVKLIIAGDKFTIEVISEEKDVEGRLAPILCSGSYRRGRGYGLVVANAVAKFASQIGRTISIQTTNAIIRAFE